ncbi:MAG: nucleotide exchange factor GrpE [Myxococcota bacterium]
MTESKDSAEQEHRNQADPDGTLSDAATLESSEVSSGGSIDELKQERDRLKEQWLRAAADLENYRRRAKKDLEEAFKRAREDVVREILPLFDNLERALGAAENATDVEAILDGVRMVLKQFEDVGGRIGLERVVTSQCRFDPNCHDAVQQVESAEHEPGTIVSELVPGYHFGGRLLRAAMVVVSKAPAKPAEPAEVVEVSSPEGDEADGPTN